MQTSQSSLGKSFWLSLSLIIAITSLFNISSCKSKKFGVAGTDCVTLASTQIQNVWVDQSYTKPGSTDLIDNIAFYPSFDGTNLTVNVIGQKSDGSQIPGSSLTMNVGSGCKTTFPPHVAIGVNNFKLSNLRIFEATGSLIKNFNYIRLYGEHPFTTCFHLLNFTGNEGN